MNVFILGSKELSVRVLDETIAQGHSVKGVLTRDTEEGMKPWLNELKHRSLKERSIELNIPYYENIDVNSDEFIKIFNSLNIDFAISVFWGQIIKEKVFNLAKIGFFNLHTALLPQNRGSFPMAWAIIKNHEYTGITFHKIASGVDDGPIVDQTKVKIDTDETGETLFQKVTNAGFDLYKDVLPKISDSSFELRYQDVNKSSYNSRGYPYGGHINPFWDSEKKRRVKNALYYPPFDGDKGEPKRYLGENKKASIRVMIGFDCDRPRGSFISTEKGGEMARKKLKSLQNINLNLEELKIKRTYFICGQFFESMCDKFGDDVVVKSFNPKSELVEIADHTYSHQVMKIIETRKDKIPLSPKEVVREYRMNTSLFENKFDTEKYINRGFRTPLGHQNGLQGEFKLLDSLKRVGVRYVSSDLRDDRDSLHPKLVNENGEIRQPYFYENGMLEIPSIGWQDTVFSKTSGTKIFETPPESQEEIMDYYSTLFHEANELSKKLDRDVFVGLVMHPYDNYFYNKEGGGIFFNELLKIVKEIGGSFNTYEEVYLHFDEN